MFGSHLLVVAMRYEKGELLPYSSTGNENFPSIFKRNRKVLNKNLKLIKMRSAVLTELPIFQTFSTATAPQSGIMVRVSFSNPQISTLIFATFKNVVLKILAELIMCFPFEGQICNLFSATFAVYVHYHAYVYIK